MNKKWIQCLLFIIGLTVVSGLSGCYRHTYVGPTPASSMAASKNYFAHHFLYGVIPASPDVTLNQICPQGVGKIETEVSFLNGFLIWLTNGIYSPKTVKVYCATPVN